MAKNPIIQTSNLESAFQALKRGQNPSYQVPFSEDYKTIPNQNYPMPESAKGAFNAFGLNKYASAAAGGGGTIYGQPQFFSPVHTPINWQIPSKRLEQYQWTNLPGTQVLMTNFTYSTLENVEFKCNDIIEDEVTGGFIFEAENYPEIMNSEGTFNQPPRISMRDCYDKRCFGFEVAGNYRIIRISEEHYVFVLKGKDVRSNRKVLNNTKYRRKKGVKPNGVVKVKHIGRLINRIQAHEVEKGDYLITPVPECGNNSLKPDLAWLVGLCAADGCLTDNTKSKNKYFRTNFTGCKGEQSLIKCEELLKENFDGVIGSRRHGDENGNGWRVVATTTKTHSFFRTYIENKSIQKRFSKEVFNLDKETRLNILGGYLDGDGCLEKKGKRLIVNCHSKDLIDQIYWLLLSCEIKCSLEKYPLYGNNYPTSSEFCYRILIPSSQVPKLQPYLKGDKIPENYTPKKERELKFFYKEDDITYLASPIKKVKEFLYTGKGFDIEMTNARHALVTDGYVCSNCRFFYENEPKVAASIDFYSYFPMNDFVHECKDRKVKAHFDKLKDRVELPKWLRLLSHEIHKLGDCFPFVEISCEHCHGSGKIGDEICEHEGGTVKRIVILNPDYVEVYTSPLNPDPVIALKPDEELTNMVNGKVPGSEKLTPQVRALIASGQPIRLDNRNVSHLMYGEGGYTKYGTGMIRRLFPTLSYKTKLMVAQWIVAERLIVPIKIVKVGSDERPAGPADIAAVQEQLAQTANDPNLTIVTHHAFELDWIGASGKVLTLSNEFDFINQEILDGMMINNALLNGEGPNYSSASIGIESTIERLESFRREIAAWVEKTIYLPEAKRQGFKDLNPESGEEEYIYPKIKWNSMHLRDQQQYRQLVLQLYEKGLLSAQTVLEVCGFNPDQEIERKRYDALQQSALGAGPEMGGMGGGFAGDMGGMPGGGGGEMGGKLGMEGAMGGMEGAMGGMEGAAQGAMGAAEGAPAAAPIASSDRQIKVGQVQEPIADPTQFGGKVLKKKTRDRYTSEQQKTLKKNKPAEGENKYPGQSRDEKGRIIFTEPEMELLDGITRYQKDGLIKYQLVPQFPVHYGNREYPVDFAIPYLKLAIEADGELFHSNIKQVTHDKERDMKLRQLGWTVLRFKDDEIKHQIEQVMQAIMKSIMKKEMYLKKALEQK